MTRLSEDVLRRFDTEMPNAREVRLHDTTTAYALGLLAQSLSLMDMAMADEDIDHIARLRVLSRVAAGCLSPLDGAERVRQVAETVRLLELATLPRAVVRDAADGYSAAEVEEIKAGVLRLGGVADA